MEEVRLSPSERIAYRVLRGPLARVTETLEFTDRDTGATLVRYAGEVGDDRPLIGPVLALAALFAYDRFMRRTLAALKVAAESRAARSKRYPSPAPS